MKNAHLAPHEIKFFGALAEYMAFVEATGADLVADAIYDMIGTEPETIAPSPVSAGDWGEVFTN
ncbi:hypothetical protein [Sphingopyxis sp. MSC1_008]|jgi:hypothetical protein|uniref:hypothetical protein n=1 Tax=Sphingopyxis sp. MSC1_008 TaxID=2909265 RepID=UPI0020C0F612|nr:hypothetical protein [Sphingopyxis sp. MSC1_008]